MSTDIMQVECSHHIDASEADAEGFYEYYYEYDIYRFTLGGLSLVVRSYSDTCEQASVLRLEEAGKSRPLQPKDLKSLLSNRRGSISKAWASRNCAGSTPGTRATTRFEQAAEALGLRCTHRQFMAAADTRHRSAREISHEEHSPFRVPMACRK
jgi:hypothetical protein